VPQRSTTETGLAESTRQVEFQTVVECEPAHSSLWAAPLRQSSPNRAPLTLSFDFSNLLLTTRGLRFKFNS
jgi:hypothetical protein